MRHIKHPRLQRPTRRRLPAFTLVELMISIAISLLLIVGINAIFRTSANMVGIGMAQSQSSRDVRAAQTVMESDFANLRATPVSNMPAFIIQSMNQVAFRDLADERFDKAFVPAAYLGAGGINPAQTAALQVDSGNGVLVSPPFLGQINNNPSILLNNRNHRVDMLSFFARGFFRRQTADPSEGTYQSTQSASEAYITYGHLRQPSSDNTTWLQPGRYMPLGMAWDAAGAMIPAAANPEQNYASQWKLGRRVMLLVPTNSQNGIKDPAFTGNVPQLHHHAVPPTAPVLTNVNLTPLAFGSPTYYDNGKPVNPVSQFPNSLNNQFPIQDSRLDLAGTTMRTYQTAVADFQASTPSSKERWYIPLVAGKDTPALLNPLVPASLIDNYMASLRPDDAFRFACKPWINKTSNAAPAAPMTFEEAMTAPMFVSGCSQFAVEFAGDYFTQNDIGTLPAVTIPPRPPLPNTPSLPTDFGVATHAAADGVLDFDVIYTLQGAKYIPVKKVRWYGMTRSIDGTNDVTFPPPRNLIPDPRVIHPVNWHMRTLTNPLLTPTKVPVLRLPFERMGTDRFPQKSLQRIDSYTCAWGPQDLTWDQNADLNYAGDATHANLGTPDQVGLVKKVRYPKSFMPWMIRITMRIDDPNGRLQEGQTVEWIYNMPHN